MTFNEINNDLEHLLREYSYFHDSIVDEIKIHNLDSINEKGHIVVKNEGDEVEMSISGQLGYRLTIKLHKTTGLRLLKLSNFIIFEVAIKKKKINYFSLLLEDSLKMIFISDLKVLK